MIEKKDNMKLEVLMVDDDHIVLFLHLAFAKRSNFVSEAILFENGEDTWDYLKEHDAPGTAFLLLLDINMSGMNGWELLDAINERQFSAQVFVVIVTSSVNEIDREKAKPYAQVIDFRIKPITRETLTEIKRLDELKQFFV